MVKRILRKYGYPPDLEERATQTVLAQAELLGWERVDGPPPADVLPFRLLSEEEARPFENCIPLYSLAAAAGEFGDAREVEPEGWVAPHGDVRPAQGLFVAQVVGESMNKRVPNGSYAVFRAPVEGARSGRVLLVQHRDIADPDHGGSYTVKIYERTSNDEVLLEPDSTASGYEPIRVAAADEEQISVIAELVEVLPGAAG
jgi:hypothetical protein